MNAPRGKRWHRTCSILAARGYAVVGLGEEDEAQVEWETLMMMPAVAAWSVASSLAAVH
jgi:hypothetical protein